MRLAMIISPRITAMVINAFLRLPNSNLLVKPHLRIRNSKAAAIVQTNCAPIILPMMVPMDTATKNCHTFHIPLQLSAKIMQRKRPMMTGISAIRISTLMMSNKSVYMVPAPLNVDILIPPNRYPYCIQYRIGNILILLSINKYIISKLT